MSKKYLSLGFSRIFPLIIISAVALLLVLTPFYKKSSVKAINSYTCGNHVSTNFGIDNAENIYNVLTNYTGIEILVKYNNFLSSTVRGYLNNLSDNQDDRIGVIATSLWDGYHSLVYFFTYANNVNPKLSYDFGAFNLENETSPTWEKEHPVEAAQQAQIICEASGAATQIGPQYNGFHEYFPGMYQYVDDHWTIQLQNSIAVPCGGQTCYRTPAQLAVVAANVRDEVEDSSGGTNNAPIWGQLSLASVLHEGYTFNDYVDAIYPSVVDGISIYNPEHEVSDLVNALNNVCAM